VAEPVINPQSAAIVVAVAAALFIKGLAFSYIQIAARVACRRKRQQVRPSFAWLPLAKVALYK
jgi:hypothetical protein